MADQKNHHRRPPTDPTCLPLKKRAKAEKSLPVFNKPHESRDSSDDEDQFKKQKLKELERKAYYSVIHAFKSEASTISYIRTQIIQKLMNEWKIADKTYFSVVDKIDKDLQHFTPVSDTNEMQIVEDKPLTNSVKKTTLSSSWGKVKPESLIGKWVSVRFPDEHHFEEFIIKEYDAKQEMHCLEKSTDSNAMEIDNSLSWMDLREIPSKDIMWPGGERPEFDVPYQSTARRALF